MDYSTYEKHFNENSFWDKVKNNFKVVGREITEKSLTLYYTLQKPELPVKAKMTIYGAIGYFIMPLDLMPDITPVLGYTDDMAILVASLAVVAMHIDDNILNRAKEKAEYIFAEKTVK